MKTKTTIPFGKFAVEGKRKTNLIEIEISVKNENHTPTLSICGLIWDSRHRELINGGQCLDTIAHYISGNELFEEIHTYWKHFHLNELNSGTYRQELALEVESKRRNELHRMRGEALETPLTYASRYADAVEYLKSIGLFVDKLTDNEYLEYGMENGLTRDEYRYGEGWIYRKIPQKVMNRIKSICKEYAA